MKTKKSEIAGSVIRKKYTGEDGCVYSFEIHSDSTITESGTERKKKIIVDNHFKNLVGGMAAVHLPKKYMARILGVDRRVFDDLLRASEDVKKAYEEGKAKGVLKLTQIAYKMAEDKNSAILPRWLEKFGVFESSNNDKLKIENHIRNLENNEITVENMTVTQKLKKFSDYTKLIDQTELNERSGNIESKEEKIDKILSIEKENAV